MKNDVYQYKQENQMYTLMKVINVTKDSVYVVMNNYESDMSTQLEDYNDALGFFKGEEYAISKEDLKEMYNNHSIQEIERDEK